MLDPSGGYDDAPPPRTFAWGIPLPKTVQHDAKRGLTDRGPAPTTAKLGGLRSDM